MTETKILSVFVSNRFVPHRKNVAEIFKEALKKGNFVGDWEIDFVTKYRTKSVVPIRLGEFARRNHKAIPLEVKERGWNFAYQVRVKYPALYKHEDVYDYFLNIERSHITALAKPKSEKSEKPKPFEEVLDEVFEPKAREPVKPVNVPPTIVDDLFTDEPLAEFETHIPDQEQPEMKDIKSDELNPERIDSFWEDKENVKEVVFAVQEKFGKTIVPSYDFAAAVYSINKRYDRFVVSAVVRNLKKNDYLIQHGRENKKYELTDKALNLMKEITPKITPAVTPVAPPVKVPLIPAAQTVTEDLPDILLQLKAAMQMRDKFKADIAALDAAFEEQQLEYMRKSDEIKSALTSCEQHLNELKSKL